MKNMHIGGLVFFVITVSSLIGVNSISYSSSTCPTRKILYVGGYGPGNYSTIKDAIDNAGGGDIIFVYNGTYYENIVINKTVSLIGENRKNTIIDGGGNGNAVHMMAEKVDLTGFSIKNGIKKIASGEKWFYAGIRVTASNNTIQGNNIHDNLLGIFVRRATNITICDNNFINDSVTFSLYDEGNDFVPFCEKYFIHNVYNNTVNGKKLYYYKYKNDVRVPEDAGQIIAVSCKNMTAHHENLSNADFGCILVNCSYCTIEYSDISYGDGMLWLINSRWNIIQHNLIENNFEGVCIDSKSTRNIIRYNNISSNSKCGIIMEDGSNYNTICKNNFVNNNPHAYFSSCPKNRWIRNYWERSRMYPYPIFGQVKFGRLSLPWFNFDCFPLLKPCST